MARLKTTTKSLLAVGIVTAIWMSSSSVAFASNGLQSEMDKLFNEMSNATPPGVYESQRRGVIAGGRFTTKTRIFDENLVSFAPPSWKAGCGGVDLFGGSLSFINADQIVQLLRAVAANAKGYAFQLALDNVFPDGAKWIENFQKKVQALNQHLGNTCQLSQGIVNDLVSGMDIKHKTDASIKATTTGLFEDFFGSKQETSGKSPLEELKENKPDEYNKMIGNIVWKQLKSNNTNTWFQYGDNTLLEAIMSLTGTVIIGDLVNDPNSSGKGAKTTPMTTLPGNKISLSDLISGASVEVYSCGGDTENCLSAGTNNKTVAIKGIKNQIADMLLGTATRPGIIYKYATNSGTLSDPEKAFVSNLPGGLGTIIRNLSVLSQDGATIFATESSGAIALAMMYSFTEEFFRAARISMANSKSPYKKEALDLLSQSQEQIRSEYSLLSSQYGDLATQIQKYNALLENIRKQKYMLATLSTPPSTK
ncbi:conjugal transfer protein TraH [Escherichia coli]|uniref:Type IV conjugative transfer system protein TraH n=1 Tax=Edwardsiella anguillarum ET080813 TaxID=667120 RepID=A0A076LPT3_9GAMM|nr:MULTISPECIES: conjugal transfer protein TraH [Edwardsiella]EFP0183603.1 conjugal transfer protein TraH [Escherichia coli]EGA8339542.1 conjugal transfer protein TraH [Salmonella enterica subsp. enterica serovar Saintpaul]EKG9744509.1 conjugal transfer protein TraH [Salmonella enterica]AIJ10625.1 type IV conjugative transfer system protein TraH [Edwardsiella anguillarum ET080813]EKS7763292.1 conjugal transfer protein TraH [Edwardsiella ictaluri]